jgi:DNA-directed RNA polymerase
MALEDEMRDFGVQRFRRSFEKAAKNKRGAETEPGMALIREAIMPLAKAVEEWREECASGRAGRRHAAYKMVGLLPADVIAFVTLKVLINSAIGGSYLTSVYTSVGSALEDEVWCRELAEKNKDLLTNVVKNLKKRGVSTRKNRRAMMRETAKHRQVDMKTEWPNRQVVVVGALFADMAFKVTGFFDTPTLSKGKREQIVIRFSEKANEWIEKRKSLGELMHPLALPMVVPPSPRTGDLSTGPYFSEMRRPYTMVKRLKKDHVRVLETANLSKVVKALNNLDKTSWRISKPVLDVLTSLWHSGHSIAGLPQREELPLPERHPWMIEEDKKNKGTAKRKNSKSHKKALKKLTKKQEAELKAWKVASVKVREANNLGRSKRISIERLIEVAHKFKDEKALYFPHDLDFRGRIYDIPTGLHPQGADYSRGMLVFAEGKYVRNTEAMNWLMIHGANTFGYDKVGFPGRITWVQDHMKQIAATVDDPLGNLWWTEADKPFCFLAWCFDYMGVREGKPSYIPVAMDGSCNGLQHFSAMLRDEVGGRAVNLVPGDVPSDIYAEVAKLVTRKLEREVEEEIEDHWIAEEWLKLGINRKLTKRPTMVMPYGGTVQSTMQYVEDAYRESMEGKASPFGDDERHACVHLGKHVHKGIREVVIKAGEAMKWLQQVARIIARNNLPIMWTTPSGFVCYQVYRNTKLLSVETYLSGRVRKQIYLKEERPGMSLQKMQGGIAPNFVHSLDASALILTVNSAAKEGVTHFAMIHDSYGTHAADTAQLAYTLREQFVKMYSKHDVLKNFLDEVKSYLPEDQWEEIPPLPERGTLDIRQVLDSEFFFA